MGRPTEYRSNAPAGYKERIKFETGDEKIGTPAGIHEDVEYIKRIVAEETHEAGHEYSSYPLGEHSDQHEEHEGDEDKKKSKNDKKDMKGKKDDTDDKSDK